MPSSNIEQTSRKNINEKLMKFKQVSTGSVEPSSKIFFGGVNKFIDRVYNVFNDYVLHITFAFDGNVLKFNISENCPILISS